MQVIVANDLESCTVNGQKFPLDNRFVYTDGCIRYQCICDADGSWQCPADRAEDMCESGERGEMEDKVSPVGSK